MGHGRCAVTDHRIERPTDPARNGPAFVADVLSLLLTVLFGLMATAGVAYGIMAVVEWAWR
jgi:hypothetical protein